MYFVCHIPIFSGYRNDIIGSNTKSKKPMTLPKNIFRINPLIHARLHFLSPE